MSREENLNTLKEIYDLTREKNWNQYDAPPMPETVMRRTFDIITELDEEHQPESIHPTAMESIQIEYESGSTPNDGIYLEFNIFKNHIQGYVHLRDKGFKNDRLLGFTSECIKKYVDEYYLSK